MYLMIVVSNCFILPRMSFINHNIDAMLATDLFMAYRILVKKMITNVPKPIPSIKVFNGSVFFNHAYRRVSNKSNADNQEYYIDVLVCTKSAFPAFVISLN